MDTGVASPFLVFASETEVKAFISNILESTLSNFFFLIQKLVTKTVHKYTLCIT